MSGTQPRQPPRRLASGAVFEGLENIIDTMRGRMTSGVDYNQGLAVPLV